MVDRITKELLQELIDKEKIDVVQLDGKVFDTEKLKMLYKLESIGLVESTLIVFDDTKNGHRTFYLKSIYEMF